LAILEARKLFIFSIDFFAKPIKLQTLSGAPLRMTILRR
jgi:hypothetical protein